MEYFIGLGLAAAVCGGFHAAGFDRDRAFYATMAVVVATYYILFAAMAQSTPALIGETLFAGVFIAMAVMGFHRSQWLIVAAIAGHGVFDAVHHLLIHNPGLPAWWPGFCLSFDILAGGFLAILLVKRRS